MPSPAVSLANRPQTLMLTLLGRYLLHDEEVAVSSGSVIDVLARIGVSESATRSTLARMVNHEMLTRYRSGRVSYFGPTRHARGILIDGYKRIWETSIGNHDWDGTWSLVAFSLPDARRDERHRLRSVLTWNGFGRLNGGLWVAAGARDIDKIVGPLGLTDAVMALSATTLAPTTEADVINRAFDLEKIARGYSEFLRQWGGPTEPASTADDLATELILHASWLELVRRDPRLPNAYLPKDWPAPHAEEVFRTLSARLRSRARSAAEQTLETIRVEPV
jgi:phenylacetic acid degradation operon negative regulatory protein